MTDSHRTPRQRTLRRWPSARCIKHFDCALYCIYTGPKGRGISTPRSHWRSMREYACMEAADNATKRTRKRK